MVVLASVIAMIVITTVMVSAVVLARRSRQDAAQYRSEQMEAVFVEALILALDVADVEPGDRRLHVMRLREKANRVAYPDRVGDVLGW